MALAVALYFDARTEEMINALREEIHSSGIPPSPLLAGGRPHLSLALVDTEDEERLSELVADFASKSPTCPVRLVSLASFSSSKGVFFLAPVPTSRLLELHTTLHEILRSDALEGDPLYRPGSWVPHCTLEMGLSGSQLASAFDSCWRTFTPTSGELVAAGVVAYPPPVLRSLTPLRAPETAAGERSPGPLDNHDSVP